MIEDNMQRDGMLHVIATKGKNLVSLKNIRQQRKNIAGEMWRTE